MNTRIAETREKNYVLTADIGGSHITAGIFDLVNDKIVENSLSRVKLQSTGSAPDILLTWVCAFKNALKNAKLPVSGLAAAMPGPFDYQTGICYIKGLNKYEALFGMDIKAHFARSLKMDGSAIRFRNDAEATIAGEVLAGAGKGYARVMGVTLGTGFGSAYCQDRVTKDLDLANDPFKDSIADDHLSTRWFLRRYAELTGKSLTGVHELTSIAENSSTGKQIFDEFAVNMSFFLAEPIKKLDPDVLILCGNISKSAKFFLDTLKSRLNGTNIRLSSLGEHAALIGAAGLFKDSSNVL
jgi:glucokinase